MPIRNTTRHRQEYNVLRDQHFSKWVSRFFDRSYIDFDPYLNKIIYAGMVLALDTDTDKYVPYNDSASYGTGSDTPVGMLHESYDMTNDEYMIEAVWHGILIEQRCYVYGATFGTVPDAVKTVLDDIVWV